MKQFSFTLSEDRSTLSIADAEGKPVLEFSADEAEGFARVLAHFRASMLPAMTVEEPVPEQVMAHPATRWYVMQDELPTQVRLLLLHPGVGWSWMCLGEQHVQQLTEALHRHLQSRPSRH